MRPQLNLDESQIWGVGVPGLRGMTKAADVDTPGWVPHWLAEL